MAATRRARFGQPASRPRRVALEGRGEGGERRERGEESQSRSVDLLECGERMRRANVADSDDRAVRSASSAVVRPARP